MSSDALWQPLFPYESRSLDLGGLRYAYVDEGQGDVLLLVHGNPTWSFYWRELIRGLSPHYRVIAVDHIGCGRSDKPADYPYRLAQHVENLTALVDRLELGNVTLLAHDWGGAIGLGAALARPDRFAPLRALQYGGLSLRTDALANSRLPHPVGRSLGGAGAQCLCPGRAVHGRQPSASG